MNTKSLIAFLFTALFLIMPVQLSAQVYDPIVPSVRNGGVRVPYVAPFVRNDNSITIYGKVYWHYVKIDNVYYNCKDRAKITEAITKLVLKSKSKNRANAKLPPINVQDHIKAIDPKLLRDPVKPRQANVKTGSSLRYPRKLKP